MGRWSRSCSLECRLGFSAGSGLTWTYGYDNANRLTWAEQRQTDGGTFLQRVDYDYDVFGNRIERMITPQVGPPSQNFFAYDQSGNVWADLGGKRFLL